MLAKNVGCVCLAAKLVAHVVQIVRNRLPAYADGLGCCGPRPHFYLLWSKMYPRGNSSRLRGGDVDQDDWGDFENKRPTVLSEANVSQALNQSIISQELSGVRANCRP